MILFYFYYLDYKIFYPLSFFEMLINNYYKIILYGKENTSDMVPG